MLFNIVERKFIIFGQIFWPQDTHLFVMAMLIFFLGVIVFTVVFGRLFCGWVCPQTVFMEMVFRPIERMWEGDSPARIRLDKAPWTIWKLLRKTGKFLTFYLVSFFIANTFLAYIIGTDELISIITDPPSEHIVGLVSILIFTTIFFGVFASLREQVCTTICPYGRLQGVLADADTVNVSYDYIRGEPRGKMRKADKPGEKGDCIDCSLCVQVCPTGIDIRNGLQLECIHCTACMDACDSIMHKVGRDEGLIRYASENSVKNRTPFTLTNRAKAYVGVLAVLIIAMVGLLVMRTTVEFNTFRTPGMIPEVSSDGYVSNLYHFVMVNKTHDALELNIETENPDFEITLVGDSLDDIFLDPGAITEGVMFVKAKSDVLESGRNKLKLRLLSGERVVAKSETEFAAPYK